MILTLNVAHYLAQRAGIIGGLAHPSNDKNGLVTSDERVHKLFGYNGKAQAGSCQHTDHAPRGGGSHQIKHFDPSLKYSYGGSPYALRIRHIEWHVHGINKATFVINRLTVGIENTSQDGTANWY